MGAVVVATGFKLFAADLKPQYGFGTYKNVITGMQMDRLLAPTRPFNTILRPGDGKVPERIAYVLCTGSRDETVDNPLCSKFCCMYSIKQNQLLMGALPLADVTVHYMDIRAAGKRYDEFYEQAKSMGATYVKGRVAKITEKDDGNLVLRYEDIENGGKLVEAEYDLVVLAVGVQPNSDAQGLFPIGELAVDEFRYVAEPNEDLNPGATSIPGVYVAGAASGAKDIADSILHAGSTAAQVAAHLERAAPREGRGAGMSQPEPQGVGPAQAIVAPVTAADGAAPAPRRIGVYVCHCGGNISDYVDVAKVVESVQGDGDVAVARTAMFACSDASQQDMIDDIQTEQPRRPGRRLVLAQAAHVHVPRRRDAGRPQPVRVHAGQHPRAVLVDPQRRSQGRDGEGHRPGRGGDRPDAPQRAPRADRRGDDAEDPRHRRRDRGAPGRHRARRHRPPGAAWSSASRRSAAGWAGSGRCTRTARTVAR